ncbi:MAG: FxsA family protein [Lentisphaeria bacterium]
MILLWLIGLFIFLPWLELLLLFKLAGAIGGLQALGVVILTGIIGASLARWQGFNTVMRIRQELNRGALPADAMLDGLFIFGAGLLLVTPGLITDAVGFSLLIPITRNAIKASTKHYIKSHFQVHQFSQFSDSGKKNRPAGGEQDQDTIDIEANQVEDEE